MEDIANRVSSGDPLYRYLGHFAQHQYMCQGHNDLVPFGEYQDGAVDRVPGYTGLLQKGLSPDRNGYDFPAKTPVMRMNRTYPQAPANDD